MPDLIPTHIADMQARGLAPKTIDTYSRVLRDFERFMAAVDKSLLTVTRHDLKAYLEDIKARPVSYVSACLYFTAIQGFYDFLLYEEIIDKNPVDPVRKRYLQSYKKQKGHTRQMISVEDAKRLLDSMVDIRNQAIFITLLKTGVRSKELEAMDVEDVDLSAGRITLKPTPKRSNRIVFFDEEAESILKQWLKVRAYNAKDGERALFVASGRRLQKGAIAAMLVKNAKRAGLHDSSSEDLEDHFGPHCARHFFTTMLDRAGMKREHIQVLRGDVGKEAIDLYLHNDLEKIREEYLRCMPELGI